MCTAKAPKVKTPDEKPVEILHNPFLDGTYGVSGLRVGRRALRIDPSSGATTGSGVNTPGGGPSGLVTAPFQPPPPVRIPRPVNNGGRYGSYLN